MQWTMWAMTELDMRLFEILMLHMPTGVHPIGEPEGYRVYFGREKTAKTTPQRLQWLYNELVWPLGVLEGALEKVDWHGATNRFPAADLNVSVVLGWALGAGVGATQPPGGPPGDRLDCRAAMDDRRLRGDQRRNLALAHRGQQQ